MLYVFIGRSGSGKTTLAEQLRDDFGFKIAKSYTTRPKRYETEDNHYFISEEKMLKIKDKIAPTIYNGYEYCYTNKELESSDIMVAEPSAVDFLRSNKIDFHVFYFDPGREVCKQRMKKRGDSNEYIFKKMSFDDLIFKNFLKDIKYKCSCTFIPNILADMRVAETKICSIINKIETCGHFRLLTDLDDVLENLCEVWVSMLSWLQRNNPDFISKSYDEITNWDIASFFPMLSIDEVFEPLNTDLIFKKIVPIEGAVEALSKYNSMQGVDVRILTASHYSSIAPKIEFLRNFFPFIKWKQLIITLEKKYVHGNVLVDDSPNNLIGGNYKGILFTQPHNRSFDVNEYTNKFSDIYRADTWNDACQIIDKMIFEYYNS